MLKKFDREEYIGKYRKIINEEFNYVVSVFRCYKKLNISKLLKLPVDISKIIMNFLGILDDDSGKINCITFCKYFKSETFERVEKYLRNNNKPNNHWNIINTSGLCFYKINNNFINKLIDEFNKYLNNSDNWKYSHFIAYKNEYIITKPVVIQEEEHNFTYFFKYLKELGYDVNRMTQDFSQFCLYLQILYS